MRERSLTLMRKPADPFVPPALVTSLNLRAGSFLEGEAEERQGKSPEVRRVSTVNGLPPAQWSQVQEFSTHEVVSPDQPLKLEGPGRTSRCGSWAFSVRSGRGSAR